MPEPTKKPFWKKAFWVLVKIYAGLCSLLVTVFVVLTIWDNLKEGPYEQAKFTLNNSYSSYMKYEYPRRGRYFYSLTMALGSYANTNSAVSVTEIVHYLGKPDHVYGTNHAAYLYEYNPYEFTTNKFFVVCRISNDKVNFVGFADDTVKPTNALAAIHVSTVVYTAPNTNPPGHQP